MKIFSPESNEGSQSSNDDLLKESLEYTESIIETVREPLIVLTSGLKVKTANRSFYKTFRVSRKDTEDCYIYELGNGQWDIKKLRALLEEILSKNTEFEGFEVEHDFQYIGRKVMVLNARKLLQRNIKEEMILVAIEDITDRKRSEEALNVLITKLEQSNRELQDFASVASHDLQEPLRKIQAFGDLLKNEYGSALPEDGQQYLQRMQNAAARMHVLINDLLAFSRITTKAQPFVPVNLEKISQEVLSDLEIHIKQVNAEVEVSSLPTIDADPLQMRQLIQNLISNSLKFHQPDVPAHIQIYAELLNEEDLEGKLSNPKMCQIFVEDNGIGFDEKYLDKIFTVFQRLHYRNEYEGTGVGLAICRKIAERHGGTITARSKLGQGATFIVTLPVHQRAVN